MTKRIVFLLFSLLLLSCSSGDPSPSTGFYTIKFPSTAAAVATDYVQILVYDFTPDQRTFACADLVAARKRQDNSARPIVSGPQTNVCELLNGTKPITVPYGEKAVLAVGLRDTQDFLIGCVIQTFGDGDAQLAIPLELFDLSQAVPETQCTSVGDRCNKICTAQ
jgi:hypothetical protein